MLSRGNGTGREEREDQCDTVLSLPQCGVDSEQEEDGGWIAGG